MSLKRIPWAWLFAILVGFGIGLAYAWVAAPVEQGDASPAILRADFKDEFRSAIAAAYASNGDLERARVRLNLLGDPNPSQALAAQAQRMLAAGEPTENVQQVAYLSSALQGAQAAVVEPSATESPVAVTSSPQTSQPVSAETLPVEATQLETESAPTSTPAELSTATPRPTRTVTPTLGAPYQLVGQDTVCDPELEEGLLQVMVTNLSRRQIPGAEIIITWNSGEEHIFSGLKPELGNGYADFVMTPGVEYSVRMADGGTPATDLSTADCTDSGGNTYTGGVRLTFQQP